MAYFCEPQHDLWVGGVLHDIGLASSSLSDLDWISARRSILPRIGS
jgi:hypothetical protein